MAGPSINFSFQTQLDNTQDNNDVFGLNQDSYLQFTEFSQADNLAENHYPLSLNSQAESYFNGVGAYTSISEVKHPFRTSGLEDATSRLQQLHFEDDEEIQQAVPQLSEFACSYCGIANPACVVQCIATKKWFCNGGTHGAGSCIVIHLVKSKHKHVQLHKESPLGDAVLECYASGIRNVFSLGFVPVASESTMVLLARDTPANHPSIKDLQLDMKLWEPIVRERRFVDWLVKVPKPEEIARARRLTVEQISKLEELWKVQPAANLEDLEVAPEEADVQPVVLRYDNTAQYVGIFKPLVKLEADYDKEVKEKQTRDNITVRWEVAPNNKPLAFFCFPRDDADVRIVHGDELRLRCSPSNRQPWECVGHVITFTNNEEIGLELNTQDAPTDWNTGYSIDFVWKSTSFDRMKNALRLLDNDQACMSNYLFHSILGQETKPTVVKMNPVKNYNVPGLPMLNVSQVEAIRKVLSSPLSLIQGPPGTGKTMTCTALVYHMVKGGTGQVLVAAPSNVAVDQLAERIAATNLKVVRLCAKSRETVSSPVESLTLHHQIRHLKLPQAELFNKLWNLRAEKGGLNSNDEKVFLDLRRRLEHEILGAADVIATTCTGAGDRRLAEFRFHHVLVDEATATTEPEALIPLTLGAKQVVLVGDHCQLGPVIMCKTASNAGLGQSLFERLRLLKVEPHRLTIQYRMHPALTEFPSNTFYEGSLQNGVGPSDRSALPDFPWPDPDRPMMFYNHQALEEVSSSGTSYLNRTEATNVEKIIARLQKNKLRASQIGVITPYEGQRAYISNLLTRNGDVRQEIEVSSVDAFQGREKDYIILSCVRSNENLSIGFLGDPRRLNVALTRARFGLIILGNARVLSRNALWHSLLEHFRRKQCLVEGQLTALKQSPVQLARTGDADANTLAVTALKMARYQPPERVAKPGTEPGPYPPVGARGSAQGAAALESAGPGPVSSRTATISKGGSAPISAAAKPFMPKSMPTYTIPSGPGFSSAQTRSTEALAAATAAKAPITFAQTQASAMFTQVATQSQSELQSQTFNLTQTNNNSLW